MGVPAGVSVTGATDKLRGRVPVLYPQRSAFKHVWRVSRAMCEYLDSLRAESRSSVVAGQPYRCWLLNLEATDDAGPTGKEPGAATNAG